MNGNGDLSVSKSVSTPRRPAAAMAGAGLALVALFGAAVAVAGHPVKGATYSGSIAREFNGQVVAHDPISFSVSKRGKKVRSFSLPNGYPVYCQGGGFGEAQTATAKVSRKGRFTAKLPIVFTPTDQNQGTVKVTGKFGRNGAERGKVITDFTNSPTCNGTSKYSTKAPVHSGGGRRS